MSCFSPEVSRSYRVSSCPVGFSYDGQACVLACPPPPFLDYQSYRRSDILNWIVTPLSLLGEIALIIPWTYHGMRARNLHKKFPFFLLISIFAIHLSLAMAWGGSRKWRCSDQFRVRSQRTDKAVWFQSFIFIVGLIAGLSWSCCLIAHLFLKTVLSGRGVFGKPGTFWNVPEWIVYHTVRRPIHCKHALLTGGLLRRSVGAVGSWCGLSVRSQLNYFPP